MSKLKMRGQYDTISTKRTIAKWQALPIWDPSARAGHSVDHSFSPTKPSPSTAATEIRGGLEAGLGRASQVFSLTEDDRDEVLTFLSDRPLHTVIMAGWILEHGVVSPQHRGTFYGYRDCTGQLKGVSVMGRNTLFEAQSEEAMIELAKHARGCSEVNMIMAEEEKLVKFWHYYSLPNRVPRLLHHEVLFEIQQPVRKLAPIEGLRLATADDLDLVVTAHADMVAQETGIHPLETDAPSFRSRCAARVDRRKVWIWRKGDELIFKVDVLAQAAEISYIEGVWMNPTHRGQGLGGRCLSALHEQLFKSTPVVCCFAEADNRSARSLYSRAGYSEQGHYLKVYL